MTRSEAWEKRRRAVTMARTYLRKAEAMLHADLPDDPVYWDLLDSALDVAYEILCKLPDDFFEMTQVEALFGLPGGQHNSSDAPQERVEKIVALLEKRRKAAKLNRRIEALENVEGRTPEEAVAYKAKAARLRAGLL